MPYSLREFTCGGCGAPIVRRRPASWDARCISCAVRASSSAALQMRYKVGPVYEKWARAVAASAARELQLVGISNDAAHPDGPASG